MAKLHFQDFRLDEQREPTPSPALAPRNHRLVGLPAAEADQSITVRLADTPLARNSARMLINRMYSWRGYGSQHHISDAATHVTFTASDEDDVIGTITLAVDSADGLAADKTFREELDVFRAAQGAKVCELTKLAFDAAVPSKALLASLFHIVFIYGVRKHECTDLFIEVNPRHRRFYEAMLGFQSVGKLKVNESVDAPSQLMWLKVSDIRQHIDTFTNGSSAACARSLYPFFFSPREEDGIYLRLSGDNRANGIPMSIASATIGLQKSRIAV